MSSIDKITTDPTIYIKKTLKTLLPFLKELHTNKACDN